MRITLPEARVESPETLGGNYDLGYQMGMSRNSVYEYTSGASARPPDLVHPQMYSEYTFEGRGFIGLTEKLDAALMLTGTNTALQMKYQFLGSSSLKAAEGTSSAAIFASFGTGASSGAGDQASALGPGGFRWTATTKVSYSEIGMSYGYRVQKDKLVYVGYAYNNHVISGVIDQARSDDLTSPAAHYELTTLRGINQSLGFGIEKGTSSKANFQLGVNQQSISNLLASSAYVRVSFSDTFEDLQSSGETKIDKASTELVSKDVWTGRDFGALGLSYLVGFGSGQGIQHRWDHSGKYFTVIDGMSLGTLISQSTSASGFTNQNSSLAAGIYAISRIWQIVDVIWFASKSSAVKNKAGEYQF